MGTSMAETVYRKDESMGTSMAGNESMGTSMAGNVYSKIKSMGDQAWEWHDHVQKQRVWEQGMTYMINQVSEVLDKTRMQ